MKSLVLALGIAAIFPTYAYAQSSDQPTAFVGVQALSNSKYLGSGDEDLNIFPYLSIDNYKGLDLFATSLSYRAIEMGTGEGLGKWSLRAGPSLTYESGRESDDSPTLAGLEDISSSVLVGGVIRGTYGPVGLQLNAGRDIAGGHDGFSANASIGTILPLGRLNIQPSATISWGSANHNQSFFGITQDQANASGLVVNDVDSGVYGYSANVVSWYELNDDYVVTLIGSHRWFNGDPDDSPILLAEDGADTGLLVSLGIARRFGL